jgi:amino acid adenylation domain-containing protein
MKKRKEMWDKLAIAASQNLNERDYWLKELSGELEKSCFPYDFKESLPGELREGSRSLRFSITGELFSKLNELSNGNHHMLHMILVAGWVILLHKYIYDGDGDIVVGVPLYRQEDDGEGEFINTVLPLRHKLVPGMTFKELLLQVRERIIQATEHYSYPMEILLEQLGLASEPDMDFPLFDVAVLVENIHDKSYLEHIRIGMTVSFLETEAAIEGKLEYNTALYRESTVAWIIKNFLHLAAEALTDVNREIRRLNMLSPDQKSQILYEFNATAREYPTNTADTVHEWFEQQVERSPGKPALEFAGKELTYSQLNQQANRLAHYLRHRGVKPGSVVGIMMAPCIEMIVGILGILKAGSAYLPIDPIYPQKRLLNILNDGSASFLLTKDKVLDKLAVTRFKQLRAADITPLRTGPRAQIKPFDRLPIPDRRLVNYEQYHQSLGVAMGKYTVSIQATRGCPFNCAYCHKLWPKVHVTRSAKNIYREIIRCREAGIRRIVFIDDVFNLDIKNAVSLLEMIIKQNLGLQLFFPNGMRGDILTTDFIDLLIEAGTVNISLALESASPRVQKLIGKNLNLEKFKENVQYITKKYPWLLLEMGLMLGFPTETEQEALQTLDFVKEQKWIHFPNLHLLKIYPNTDMYRLAVENGIPDTAIQASVDLAYHELPETLPYDKAFVRREQTRFMNEYMLSKERLLHLLPHQARNLTEDELVQKYDSYFPAPIKCVDNILELAGITREELGETCFLEEEKVAAPNFSQKFKPLVTVKKKTGALKVLLLDLSQFFSSQSPDMLFDMVEAPLGLMYLLTYLEETLPRQVEGKIAKSRFDFDNYQQLKELIADFNPDLIGIRTLSFHKDFFHRTVSLVRQWGIDVPIIAGGPYATSEYQTLLQDPYIDLVVLGEGELTLRELVEKILENNKKLPGEDVLKQVKGIAFAAGKDKTLIKQNSREIIFMDNILDTLDCLPTENPVHVNQSRDLLYLISTSGSGGEPKSVMLEHRNMMNLLHFEFSDMGVDFSRNILQFASIGFDVSAQEIFSTLLSGGKLWLIDRDLKGDVLRLFDFIRTNEISIVFWPPAFLKLVFSEPIYINAFPRAITHIIAAGEQLIVPRALKEYLKNNRVYLINHYGPSETHVVTSLTPEPTGEIPGRPSIGKPISNTAIYILDKNRSIQPIGIAGELCIGGNNVGRGYLNNPELTAEKFNQKFLRGVQGGSFFKKRPPGRRRQKIYRTGDLARWLPDGNIEFIGRTDHQVQIRGFRVELGEIEKRVMEIEYIKEVVVLERENETRKGKNYLCAYVAAEIPVEPPELREVLGKSLPDYMIPSYFVQIERIPLTVNGKVHRKVLPDPETVFPGKTHVAPQNEIEERLTDLWANALGMEKENISVTNNFFELGGNSLDLIRLNSALRDAFDMDIGLGDLMKHPTIGQWAGLISDIKPTGKKIRYPAASPEPETIHEPFPLTDIQMAYLLGRSNRIEMGGVSTHAYLEYKGKLDIQLFNQSLNKLIVRHPMLRAVITEDGYQRILEDVTGYEVEVEDITHLDAEAQEKRLVKERERMSHYIFKPDQWPLFEIKAFNRSQDIFHLCIGIDPLIVDAFSMMIIARELGQFYGNPQLELPKLQFTFRDYMLSYDRLKQSEITRRDREYWLSQLEGFPPAPVLPLAANPEEIKKPRFKTCTKIFARETWERLKKNAGRNNITPSALLCTAYAQVLAYWSNQPQLAVNLTVFNRFPFHKEVDHIVGDFTSVVLLGIALKPNTSFWERARGLQDRLFEGLEHRHYDGVNFIRELARHRDLVNKTVMPIVFTSALFDNQFTAGNNIPGDQYQDSRDKQIFFSPGDEPGVEGIAQTSQVYIDNAVTETDGRLMVNWSYVEDIFDDRVIDSMFRQYKALLIHLAENDGEKIDVLQLPPADREILGAYNKTGEEFRWRPLHQLFSEQVRLAPHHTALICDEQTITYGQLDERSNRVADYLRQQGVGRSDLVGVLTPRNIETIVHVLGVLKSGAAYVPIDPDYPEDRQNYIINNSNCKLLLETNRDAGEYKIHPYKGFPGEGRGEPCVHPAFSDSLPEDLAYVIYTSGSTGRPKGVVITHREAVNTIIDINRKFRVNNCDRILGISSMCFDLSVYDVFGALSTGAALVLLSDQRDIPDIIERVKKYGVTVWNSVPAIMELTVNNIIESRSPGISREHPPGEVQEEEIYYWSPVVHWKVSGAGVWIGTRSYPGMARELFPKLYFLTQEGISLTQLYKEFPGKELEGLRNFIRELVRERVLVNSILSPDEIFQSQTKFLKHVYDAEILVNAEAYERFKKKQLGRTYPVYQQEKIILVNNENIPAFIRERRTYRQFDEGQLISFQLFSHLFSIFKQTISENNGTIYYYYASAGGLYPVDLFVYVKKARVENLEQGLYYYSPKDHSLSPVNSNAKITEPAHHPGNREIFRSSAFTIFMIYNAEVSMPRYGGAGYYMAGIDAGIMVGTMTQVSEMLGFGVCSIGAMNFQAIRRYFHLDKHQVFLHAMEVGLKPDAIKSISRDKLTSTGAAAMESPEPPIQVPHLRLVLLSGDWVPVNLPEKIRRHFPNAEVVSLGGATEGSIWSIYYPVKEVKENWKSIPYGYPLANQTMHVLNYEGNPCPIGVPGEIHIGGTGTAEGYLNDIQKTSDSFFVHPRLGRIYRTGDYGVFHQEGYIEFLGRKDQQVKIRGYRIELGEIESCLLDHESVTSAVVIDGGESSREKYLAAYFVSDSQTGLSTSSLRSYLSKKLPGYMIPSYFVRMEKIPLTANGKVDRKALPGPGVEVTPVIPQVEDHAAPQTGSEKIIADILKEKFKLQRIGIHDNFFDLGANSSDILDLSKKIKQALNRDVPLLSMFEFPTVGSLASYLSQEKTQKFPLQSNKRESDYIDRTRAVTKAKDRLKQRVGKESLRGKNKND